jgi:uncharacterized protein
MQVEMEAIAMTGYEGTLALTIKTISETGQFEGMLSTYGHEDLGGDVIERGAFTSSLKARCGRLRILMDHDLTRRAGTGYITETPDGLHCRGVLIMDSPIGQQAYAEVKHYQMHGPPMALSIGYKTRKDRWKNGTRYIGEGELWEGSLVSFGMNPEAFVTSVKRETPGMDEDLASWHALAADIRSFVRAHQASRDPDAEAWAHLHTAEPALAGQMTALAADIRRWIRHYR